MRQIDLRSLPQSYLEVGVAVDVYVYQIRSRGPKSCGFPGLTIHTVVIDVFSSTWLTNQQCRLSVHLGNGCVRTSRTIDVGTICELSSLYSHRVCRNCQD